jgi:hypothetical protein
VNTSIWNGSAWSTPEQIASTVGAQQPSITYVSGRPVVVWAQDVDGDPESSHDWRVFSSAWDGVEWSEPEQVELIGVESAETWTSASGVLPSGVVDSSVDTDLATVPAPQPECCTGSCGGPVPPDPGDGGGWQRPSGGASSQGYVPIDPNEKTGAMGIGPGHAIDAGDRLGYAVYFENLPEAEVPAQEVFVTDCLDHDLDWTSVSLEEIAFGDVVVANTIGGPTFDTRVAVPDHRPAEEKDWWVDVSSRFDLATGCLDVTFRTLDPATGELPDDVFAGFLPPEDGTGRGQGHVSFSVDARSDLDDGVVITNRGIIVFDVNEAIATNTWSNTVGTSMLPVLTVMPAGSGSGTVTSDPAGIDCGFDCQELFAPDAVVTLSAAADPGSVFGGWVGGGCSGTGTCQLTMTGAHEVSALFEPEGGCGLCDSMTLEQMRVDATHLFEACTTIMAGNGLEVTGSADVTLRAGQSVVLTNGFSLGVGASLTVDIDPGVGSP